MSSESFKSKFLAIKRAQEARMRGEMKNDEGGGDSAEKAPKAGDQSGVSEAGEPENEPENEPETVDKDNGGDGGANDIAAVLARMRESNPDLAEAVEEAKAIDPDAPKGRSRVKKSGDIPDGKFGVFKVTTTGAPFKFFESLHDTEAEALEASQVSDGKTRIVQERVDGAWTFDRERYPGVRARGERRSRDQRPVEERVKGTYVVARVDAEGKRAYTIPPFRSEQKAKDICEVMNHLNKDNDLTFEVESR